MGGGNPADNGLIKTAVEPRHEVPARKARRQRGAALIEMALVAPMLVIMVFGIIDFGSVLSSYQELRSAVREGARVAAVNNGCPNSADPNCAGTPAAQLTALKDATRARATGILPIDQSNITIDVCFLGGATGLPLPPGNNPAVGIDNVRFIVTYPASSFTGLFGGLLNSITLTTTSVFRLEKVPTYAKDCP